MNIRKKIEKVFKSGLKLFDNKYSVGYNTEKMLGG